MMRVSDGETFYDSIVELAELSISHTESFFIAVMHKKLCEIEVLNL